MPSASLPETSLLLSFSASASFTSPSLQSLHVAPPSRLAITPLTSMVANMSWGEAGSSAMRITRQANGIFARSLSCGLASLCQCAPPSVLL